MGFRFNFETKKFTTTIAGASIFIAVSGFLSKGIGFFREIVIANFFGLSVDYDIYLVGAVLPLTINTILLCIGQNYIIPQYNKLRTKNEELAIGFVQSMLIVFFLCSTFVTILLYSFSDLFITSFFQLNNSNFHEIVKEIFRLFLFTIPLTSIISVIIAYQQSTFEFRYFVISNILLNTMVLLSVILLSSINIYSIPIGYIIGIVLQLIYLVTKSKILFVGLKFFSNIKNVDFSFSYSILTIILIESISQLYVISDRYFFNKVSIGGISALNYSQTLFLLPISILTIALSTAIFPKFSELINRKLIVDLEKLLNQGISSIVFLFVPIMFLFIYFGKFIIKIIFERGMFSSTDTLITNDVLVFYSISIVFYAVYGIFNKLIYSAGLISKLFIITLIGTMIKIALNFILVNYFQQVGLALSTSLSYFFFFTTSYFLILNKFNFVDKYIFPKEFFFHSINGAFALLIAELLLVTDLISTNSQIIEMFIFILFYLVNLSLLKNESIKSIYKVFIKN